MRGIAIFLVVVGLALVPAIPLVCAQSREDAIRLHREAHELLQNAQSNAEMKQAEGKYLQALSAFERLGDRQKTGVVYNGLGRIYAAWGQYARAVECYEKSLDLSTETGNLLEKAWALINQGTVFLDLGQYDKAGDYFEKSLAIMRELKDPKGEGSALNNLGNVYQYLGQNDKAMEYYEKSLAVKRELQDRKGEGSTLTNLGNVYKDWGQYDKAVEYYGKSLAIAREFQDRNPEANALNNLGNVYEDLAEYGKAVEYYEKSLATYRELKDRKSEGSALMNLGGVLRYRGQHGKAVDYYEKSLAICRELEDRRGEGQNLTSLGNVYQDWGEYGKAVDYYEKSLAICRELKDRRGEGQNLTNLGNVYQDWGEYDKAVDYYDKDLAICRELKDRRGEGQTLNNLGVVFSGWGQYDKAMEYYEKSLAIKRELKDRIGEGFTINNLGNIYVQRREFRSALENFTKAMNIYQEIGVPVRGTKNVIGNLYLDMGELGKAEPLLNEAGYSSSLGRLQLLKQDYQGANGYYEKLLQFAERNRDVANLFTAYTGLGSAYEGIGDNKKAEEYFMKAVNLTEDLRSSLPRSQREKFFGVRINGFLRTAPYDGLARIRVKMNKQLEAFEISEHTKSRIFAESMSKRSESTSFDIPHDILTKDRELNDQLATLKKKRQEGYEKADQEIITVVEPQVQEMENTLQAHVKMLREKYPLFAATKYPEPMDMRQSALKPNEWVLAYHVTDPGIIIYLTQGKEIVKALYKPIPRDNLDKLILTFRKPLEIVPGKDDFVQKLKSFDLVAGKKLSDLLLSDVLENLPKQVPLLIVPDDSLGMLPFEMLVLNDKGAVKTDKDLPYISGAEFFGDRNVISYCQSVTALTLSRIHAKSKGSEAGLLAIADPVFRERDDRVSTAQNKGPTGVLASLFRRLIAAEESDQMGGLKFPRLRLTGNLAKALSEMYKKGSEIYTGFDASKSNFLDKISPVLNRYDKIVFATHGYFGKDLPGIMEPVLVLTLIPPGTDGYLRMTEVLGLNINADIVALTACQTGLGKRTAGEGTMGMGRAFQYAGARSVLMSLWSVSEVQSVNLVKSFFRNMKDGKNKSEALASARGEIRKKGFDHPFFWAGFILVGEGN